MEIKPNISARLLELALEGNAGLAADIDGTLSAIAASPSEALIKAGLRQALLQLHNSGFYNVIALVSGRNAAQASAMVGLPQLVYIGNHGMEVLNPGKKVVQLAAAAASFQPLIAAALEAIRLRLQPILPVVAESQDWTRDLLFEFKGITASIHYRNCADPELTRQKLLPEVLREAEAAGLKVSEGRMVIELRPPVAINKGSALEKVLAEVYKLNSLVYLGDDLTDVDGFKALRELEQTGRPGPGNFVPFNGLAIGVRSREMPEAVRLNADYLVDGVSGVEELLVGLSETLPVVKPPIELNL